MYALPLILEAAFPRYLTFRMLNPSPDIMLC